MRALLFTLLLVALPLAQASKIDAYQFDDSAQEESYRKLTEELRCLVCQNQNIADSNAELAQDLRRKTYEMITAGKSEQEVVDFMVQRYGDFVMYRPPFNAATVLLWIGPFAIMIVGVVVLMRFVRKRPAPGDAELSSEERNEAERLLQDDDDEEEERK